VTFELQPIVIIITSSLTNMKQYLRWDCDTPAFGRDRWLFTVDVCGPPVSNQPW